MRYFIQTISELAYRYKYMQFPSHFEILIFEGYSEKMFARSHHVAGANTVD